MHARIELIEIKRDENSQQFVDARELWEVLGCKTQFANWIKAKVVENPIFKEFEDWTVFPQVVKQNHNGCRRRKDYSIRMDVAKRIAMTEKTEKSERIGEYFRTYPHFLFAIFREFSGAL